MSGSIIIYQNADYKGPFLTLGPGFYSGENDLVGHGYHSSQDANLYRNINSIRVQPNTIVALYGSTAPSASGGSRVIQGPAEFADLGSIGMTDKISSVLVVPFKTYDSGIPRGGGATISNQPSLFGMRSDLVRGDYNPSRLNGDEIRMPGPSIQSLQVEPHCLAILYSGPHFDTTMDAVAVVGPTLVDDLSLLGMLGRVASIRIIYTDPYDVPYGRPISPLGSSRDYLPGGSWGMGMPVGGTVPPFPSFASPGRTPWAYGYGAPGLNITDRRQSDFSGLTSGARDLLFPEAPYGAISPRNWAGGDSMRDDVPSALNPDRATNSLMPSHRKIIPNFFFRSAESPSSLPDPHDASYKLRRILFVILLLILIITVAAIITHRRKRGVSTGGSILPYVINRSAMV